MAIFTLEEARQLLPQVKDITQHYHDLVEVQRDALADPDDAAEVARVEQRMNELLQEWVSAINALGVDVKGLWLADFDSGDGYYFCWKLGEADIEHFHRYETGFAGRRPIERLA
jgi:hypothetical protein